MNLASGKRQTVYYQLGGRSVHTSSQLISSTSKALMSPLIMNSELGWQPSEPLILEPMEDGKQSHLLVKMPPQTGEPLLVQAESRQAFIWETLLTLIEQLQSSRHFWASGVLIRRMPQEKMAISSILL